MVFILSVILTIIVWKKVIMPLAKSMSKMMFDESNNSRVDSENWSDTFSNWWFD